MKRITGFENPHDIINRGKSYRSIFVREIDDIEYFVMLPIDPTLKSARLEKHEDNDEFLIPFEETSEGLLRNIWDKQNKEMTHKLHKWEEFSIGTVKELIDTHKIYKYCYIKNSLFGV